MIKEIDWLFLRPTLRPQIFQFLSFKSRKTLRLVMASGFSFSRLFLFLDRREKLRLIDCNAFCLRLIQVARTKLFLIEYMTYATSVKQIHQSTLFFLSNTLSAGF